MSASHAAAGASKPSSCVISAASASGPSRRSLGIDVLPAAQEAHEVLARDGLDLRAQPLDRVAMNAREQRAIAPFALGRAGRERAPHREAFAGELGQRHLDVRRGQRHRLRRVPWRSPVPVPASRPRTISTSASSRVHDCAANSAGAAIGGESCGAWEHAQRTAAGVPPRPTTRLRRSGLTGVAASSFVTRFASVSVATNARQGALRATSASVTKARPSSAS